MESTFAGCTDGLEKRQLCYLLARQGFALALDEGPAAVEDEALQVGGVLNSRWRATALALRRRQTAPVLRTGAACGWVARSEQVWRKA